MLSRLTCKSLRCKYTGAILLAHLSQRLIGELIVYPCSGVRRCCRRRHRCCRRPPFSNVFSSETAWPIKDKFYVEPPWEGGTKVYINGPGHMTKMAAMPIYGKNLKGTPITKGLSCMKIYLYKEKLQFCQLDWIFSETTLPI